MNFFITLALWVFYAVIYFAMMTQGLGTAHSKAEILLLVTTISVLSFAVGNTLALLDLRKGFPPIAWRPGYTIMGILVALGIGLLWNNLPSSTILGILAIIMFRSAFGPNAPKKSRSAKNMGI